VARRALPGLLALSALISDLSGGHGVALVFLLVSIPAAFALTLDCYGDALHARCGGFRPFAAALALVLLVVSAALRSPAVVGGVPQFAVSAVVLTLLLYGGAFAAALLPRRELVRITAPPEAGEPVS
jgi:hypothetical protein